MFTTHLNELRFDIDIARLAVSKKEKAVEVNITKNDILALKLMTSVKKKLVVELASIHSGITILT